MFSFKMKETLFVIILLLLMSYTTDTKKLAETQQNEICNLQGQLTYYQELIHKKETQIQSQDKLIETIGDYYKAKEQ